MNRHRVDELRAKFSADGWPLVPLRVSVGLGFAAHGYAKLARGPEHFAAILSAIGIPAPAFMAWATSLFEFLGGISLIVGAAVVPLCFPLAAIMITALFSVHFRYGFSSVKLKGLTASGAQFGPIGYELNLLYIAALLALATSGAGRFSVDQWMRAKRKRVE